MEAIEIKTGKGILWIEDDGDGVTVFTERDKALTISTIPNSPEGGSMVEITIREN